MLQVKLPAPVAEELIEAGGATRLGTMGGVAEIALAGLTVASLTITLLQGPDTFLRLARIIKDRATKRDRLIVRINGKLGRIEFEVTEDTDLAKVAEQIQDGLLGRPSPRE